jgi:hypothetical protein
MHNFFRTLAPERFYANVVINVDGSYAYTYDGVLIFVPALIQACRAGFLEPHIEARLKVAAGQLRQEGFQHADYLGRGRYAVTLERAAAKGQPSYFPSREMTVFSIRPRSDGTIIIIGSRPDTTAPCQLTGTDAEIDGRLIVRLDAGVPVISHNAQSRVSIADPLRGYEWRIKSPDDDPFIIVQPVM